MEQIEVVSISKQSSYSVDGLIDYCEGNKKIHEQALDSVSMQNYEEGFVYAMGFSAKLARELKNEIEGLNGGKITIDSLVDVFSNRVNFSENEPSQFNYGQDTAMRLCLDYAQNLKAVLEREAELQSNSTVEHIPQQQALYSVEQGDELRYYRAPNGYTADDILKATNSSTPFLKLMDMGKQISGAKYAEIEQSDKCAVSITINLDTDNARIYEINGGDGGISESDRNDNNVRFTEIKISEYTRNTVEHIPPQRDISHKTNNSAELSAAEKSANGQIRSIIMSNNTKLSVSSMTILGEDSSAKAFATVTINDEFAIRNVKVFEGKNGPFVSMPSRKIDGEYQDVVFPITKEAREQFNTAVIDCYNEMQKNGEEHFMSENTPPEKAISTITASVNLSGDGSNVKAKGQIVIDGSFVVSGVCVIAGNGNLFASMPAYTNDIGDRKDFAFPITKECYENVQGAVLNDFNYIQSYHEMGGKDNLTTAYDLGQDFAGRLSAELNKNGITNIVKVKDGTANISVKIEDKERFVEIRKELAQSLKQEKKARDGGKKSLSERIGKAREQQSEKIAEQPKQPQPHRKPNQAEL